MEPTTKLINVCVDGYEGSWSEIGRFNYRGVFLMLLEHDDLGDMANALIVVRNGHNWEGCEKVAVVLDDVCNGFDDLTDMGLGELDRRLARIGDDRLASEHIERSRALFAAAANENKKEV